MRPTLALLAFLAICGCSKGHPGWKKQTVALVDPCFELGPQWGFVEWQDADEMIIVCEANPAWVGP